MQNDEVLFGDKFLYYVQFICYVGFSKLGTEKSGVVQAGASLLQLLSKQSLETKGENYYVLLQELA